MAPKKTAKVPAHLKPTDTGSVLSNTKLIILNTKQKLSSLRSSGPTMITKPALKSKTITQARTPQTSPPHEPLRAPSALTAHDFEVGGTLGKGKFGRVYLARHIETNYVCALKIISKAQCSNEEEERLIRRELEVHQNLTHKNILKLLSWFHDDKSIYLVLEYAPGGSLYSCLRKQPKGRFDERTAAQYVAQMAEALRYMHGKNIIHRDIKPENILLGLHREIKLADFGYSVHSESGFRSTVCGTLDYLSPEVVIMMIKPGKSRECYTKAIDQWSLGVLTYELLVGKAPFEMKSTLGTQKEIASFKGKGIESPSHASRDAEDMITKLLNMDGEERLGSDGVLVHPRVKRHVERSIMSGIRKLDRMLERAV
ncbi:Pkinase-domain-containing protein [Setomelanomma holmii]|uniref:Aurora kinase n=1 Tax=Setomelanomma holmii TaxID=210430 RepID=A0A9P4LSF9_9PLEO|nr:Pkinase-domain-containing protein [Setomelanomma holmii]